MVLIGQRWLYSVRNCCFRAKMVVFKKSCCVPAKVVVFGISGCMREKWLYSGKVVVFG